MILTGVGHKNKKKLTRTLGSMLKSDFAQKEIIPEYRAGSIMFQLLWDIAECEIFKV